MEGVLKCKHLGALGQCGALCTLSGEPRETGAAAEKQVRRVLKEAALVGEGGGGLAVPETSLADPPLHIGLRCIPNTKTFLVAQKVKHLPTMRETRVQSLSREDLLEKEMATHSSILAWKIPWIEEPGRLQSMGSQRVGHN